MHEVSIALGIVDELMKIARDNEASKINSVKLKIGKMSGIVSDSLLFAFDAVKLEHSLLSGTTLDIEEVPVVCECIVCKTRFEHNDISFPACPNCESFKVNILSGEEQHIDKVEMEI